MPSWDNGGVKTLMVAGAGGHLEELWLLRPRLVGVPEEVVWATPDTLQSRSLLRGEEHLPIPLAHPRDVRATVRLTRQALAVVRAERWGAVVSTGSLPAVPFMAVARARGVPCHFIESAARVDAPSMAAQILERLPGVHRYPQYPRWAREGWRFRGSVFDGFVARPTRRGPVQRAVVTVGSSRYGFRRLLDVARRLLPRDVEVLWQTGSTNLGDLSIPARAVLPAADLAAAMAEADLVIAHAGVGSALMALQAGKCPVLVPRRKAHGEHVDDHQHQVAEALGGAGLALVADPGTLTSAHLTQAAATSVAVAGTPPPFVLDRT